MVFPPHAELSIRSELFSMERLEQEAERLAAADRVTIRPCARQHLARRLQDNGRALVDAYRDVETAVREERVITPADQWLVDNFYVAQQQIRQVQDHLPRGFFRALPTLAEGPLEGYPRVFGVAWALVAHTDSRLDRETLVRFVSAYQRVQPLTMSELWAVAVMLRLVLVENLRRSAEQITSGRAACREADTLADRLLGLGGREREPPETALPRSPATALPPAFVVRLQHRLRDQDPRVTPVLVWLAERLARENTTTDEIVRKEYQRQGGLNVTVCNVITSMRLVSTLDWEKICERVSLVDAALGAGSSFARMDFPTRDRYRQAIQDLARGSDRTELDVARRAMAAATRLASEPDGHDEAHRSREHDPGYYLIAQGRRAFEKEIGFRISVVDRLRRAGAQAGTVGRVGAIALITVSILAPPLLALTAYGVRGWPLLLIAVLGLAPTADLAVAVLNRATAHDARHEALPALELRDEVPADLRTMVVVPAVLATRTAVADLLERLEVHYLASRDGELYFALLSDWTDSTTQTAPGDDELLGAAVDGVAQLNRRYGGPSEGPRFFLLHRRRAWNEEQGTWVGWDRTRGQLHDLNRWLRGATETAFVPVNGAVPVAPSAVRYVITLDAATRLPREMVRRLVGTMAHPLNRPRLDLVRGRVAEGYAVLQSRVAPLLPTRRDGSLFQRVFTSPSGLDPNAFAVSDVDQDLFGAESYIGKGIYDVDVFEAALGEEGTESALLSHDLLEGTFARARLVPDVEVVEEFPSRYDVASARQYRWARLDWQLLPWIFGRGLHTGGGPDGRAIPLIGRWHMLTHLARTLPPPAVFLALLAGWTLPLAATVMWTGFIVATAAIPPLLPVVAGLVPRRLGLSQRRHWHAVGSDVALAILQIALLLTLVAHQAWVMADAITRTLFRLFVSRRRRLAWMTAARLTASGRLTLRGMYRWMSGGVVLAVFAAVVVAYLAPHSWPIAAPFLILWALSPVVAQRASLPRGFAGAKPISGADARVLKLTARRTWRFFETFVTTEDHGLPPDNVQDDPTLVIAHRTSPTNIGLYLLSVIAARDFGWLGTVDAVSRIESTLAAMNSLERFHGHFYNWYDTRTLRPLEPKYVSAVDSGNLAGHLIALGSACRQMHVAQKLGTEPGDAGSAASEPSLGARLEALIELMRTMVDAMDFGLLFDSDRQLLSIGYLVDDRTLDPTCYDLLASEARLASFVAIAKGDVPTRHWFHLGRTVTPVHSGAALISWSGSMFEYLMPSLVMRPPPGSLLDETCQVVVRRQAEYGAARGLPWGVSESAYNARNQELTYQYSSFGVPGLGFRRGLGDDAVVAPYATALAAMITPHAAVRNYANLAGAGGCGQYGWYEALDYTPTRLPEGEMVAVVHSYMAHHQGMTLIALANALHQGAMRARFHADPIVQATELLLQERTPRDVEAAIPRREEARAGARVKELVPPSSRRLLSAHQPIAHAQLLSNGRYSVMMTAAGSGYSRWGNLAVTRWREDATCDDWGMYIFIRDADSGSVWSAGYQPSGVEPDRYEATFLEDRVEILRRDGTITTRLDVIVSPEEDAEARRVTISNGGSRAREIDVTSYAEVVLASGAADTSHPAFSNLFVQTEFVANIGALLATRRRRSPDEPAVWAAHLAVVEGEVVGPAQFETDRARFVGRGHGIRTAMSVMDDRPLSNTAGVVLDPIFALRRRIRLAPGATARVTFWTSLASSRGEVIDLAGKHQASAAFERASMLAWTQAQALLFHLGIDLDEAGLFQRLAGHLLYTNPGLRPASEVLSRSEGEPPALWAYGISGDVPIVVCRIDDIGDLQIVRDLLRAHEYWRMKQLPVDLVILNEHPASYAQDLQAALEAEVRAIQARQPLGGAKARGALFVLRADLVSVEVRSLLESVARAVLFGRRGSLFEQLRRLEEVGPPSAPPAKSRALAKEVPPPALRRPELEYFNGLGGFAAAAREYVTILGEGQWTPMPWINVIANPAFGFLASVEGGGYTWAVNSQQHQLTPWSNDPVSDRPGEVLYVRDEDDGALWTPTALPIREDASPYVVSHGQGYSRFEHASHGVSLALLQFVPPDDPIKISRLTITNRSGRSRRLSITAYVEWVLGASRAASAPFVVTEIDPDTHTMLARNHWATGFGTRVAFADLGGRQRSWTGDRKEFLGLNGTLDRPASLTGRAPLRNAVGGGFDPCGALQTVLQLEPDGVGEIVFFLGEAATREEALSLVTRYRTADLDAVFSAATGAWQRILSTVQVKTPDRAMDVLLNHWLLYQTLACRVWARAAFYQASGAYGFRDQLQDVLALCVSMPQVAREHVLRAAGRQFVEGDVQHWWLPPSGQGVRTRISDDRLWLPYAIAHYVEVTGDAGVLDETVPFLDGPLLKDGQQESVLSADDIARAGHAVRPLRSCPRQQSSGRQPRPAADRNRRLERRVEPGRGRGQGRKRLARLVSSCHAVGLCAVGGSRG